MMKEIYIHQKETRKYFVRGSMTICRLFAGCSGKIQSGLLKLFSMAENVSEKPNWFTKKWKYLFLCTVLMISDSLTAKDWDRRSWKNVYNLSKN